MGLGLLGVPACDSNDAGGSAAANKTEIDAKADAPPSAADAPQAAADGDDDKADEPRADAKDRGEGSATIGGQPWVAETARAKLEDGKLRLTLSKMDMTDKGVARDAFSLVIDDYAGPGDYTTKSVSSNFSGVAFDVERAKAAVDADGKADDAKVTAQAIDTMKKAEVILMRGTEIHIESATADEFVGTFAWEPNGSMANKPAVTDGKFRAVVRKKK